MPQNRYSALRYHAPHRQAFILFEAQADTEAGTLNDVEISEQPYLFPTPAGWAPNLLN